MRKKKVSNSNVQPKVSRSYLLALWNFVTSHSKKININLLIALGALIISWLSLLASNKSVKLTNDSLKATQDQFYQLNKPFLQIEIIKKDKFSAVYTVDNIAGFEIRNLGNYPARILAADWGVINEYLKPVSGDKNLNKLPNLIVTKENPLFIDRILMFEDAKFDIDSAADFFGNITYQNPLNNLLSTYSFSINLRDLRFGFAYNVTKDSIRVDSNTFTHEITTLEIHPYIPKDSSPVAVDTIVPYRKVKL